MAPKLLTDLNNDVLLCIFDEIERPYYWVHRRGFLIPLASTCKRLRNLSFHRLFSRLEITNECSMQVMTRLINCMNKSDTIQKNTR